MKIVNGKKFYEKEVKAAVEVGGRYYTGWSNTQYYTVLYNPECGLVIVDAHNTGDCYGDYGKYYFDSVPSFIAWCTLCREREWTDFAGRDVDENDTIAMGFADACIESVSTRSWEHSAEYALLLYGEL